MTAPVLSESRCQCTACGDCFNSTTIFDLHRVGAFASAGELTGNRRCMTPDEMTARGYCRNGAGCWVQRLRQARTAPPQGPSTTPPATTVAERAT